LSAFFFSEKFGLVVAYQPETFIYNAISFKRN